MRASNRRVALVTGANRGIGFAIARQLSRRGLAVVLGCRDENKGAAARVQIAHDGGDAHVARLDVTDATSIRAAVDRIEDRFGRLDVLINNAGIQIDGGTGVLELGLETVRHTLATNAFGPLLLSQASISLMQANGYGRIVNIASTLGSLSDIADPASAHLVVDAPAYRMSKILLNAVTVLLAKALRGGNILVNSVCPGWVRTEMGGSRAPRTAREAADTPVWLATLPDDGPTGGFFRDRQPIAW